MTGRQVLFQVHWLLGITAGLVLAVMGITGALYSFQSEIMRTLNPDVMEVSSKPTNTLSLPELVWRIEAAQDKQITRIRVSMDGTSAGYVNLRARNARGDVTRQYYDPYTGMLLGQPQGQAFFTFVLELHRFLAMGERGRIITGAGTLGLIFFCLSGLYLRWPRDASRWRAWLTLDWARTGRSFNWDLHAVAGTWCLLFYLLFALTGLWWSYDWYREGLRGLFGTPGKADTPMPAWVDYSSLDLQGIWEGTRAAAGGSMEWAVFRFPSESDAPVVVSYALRDGAQAGSTNVLRLEPASGRVISHDRYADKPPGEKLLSSIYPLHTGEFFGLPGRVAWTVASLAMPLFFITGWLLYLDRRRKQRLIRQSRGAVSSQAGGAQWLIGFASQSGFAEQLAWQTAGQLQAAGHSVAVESLARLDETRLRQADRALFVISTFGDGEPPDSAKAFERRMLSATLDLASLSYGLLALGDQQYQQFCGFARRINHWLHRGGARTLFAPVEVNNADPRALLLWREQLASLTGIEPVIVQPKPFGRWRLQRRHLLNAGSQGAPVYLVSLVAESLVEWQAGDILVVWPSCAADESGIPPAGATREYSIASLPRDGTLDLIVRQTIKDDGSLGLGSGWLTRDAQLLGVVRANIRRNSGFHAPAENRPMILIGNGTGIAGLRSLMKERIAAGRYQNWLLFGERNARHDFLCGEEISGWLNAGHLELLDLAFSRDQTRKHYVQDLIGEHADEIRRWVAAGAAIYVCGSLQGMAAGVDAALRGVLGEAAVTLLIEAGRYRRDVY